MTSTYREWSASASLTSLVACLWEQEPVDDHVQLIVPDGCLDLIWLSNRELVIAGADTSPRRAELPGPAHTWGIRLRPGAAGAVLGMPASELRDQEVSAALVWGAQRAEQLNQALAAGPPERRAAILESAVAQRKAIPDTLVSAAARRLADAETRISILARDLGVSERQLHRRTLSAVGYGPKMLGRVARLRRLVALGDGPLARRATVAGYANQAHMNEEVRRLTGATPVCFLKDATLTAA